MTTFALDPPAPAGACVTLMLMRNVKNMNAVVARMRSGELCMAIVDARMVHGQPLGVCDAVVPCDSPSCFCSLRFPFGVSSRRC